MCRCEQQADRSMEDRKQGGKSPSTHIWLMIKVEKIKMNKVNCFWTALAPPRLEEHRGRGRKNLGTGVMGELQ